jgi:hypothetical protein
MKMEKSEKSTIDLLRFQQASFLLYSISISTKQAQLLNKSYYYLHKTIF